MDKKFRDFIEGKLHINHWLRAQDITTALDQFSVHPLSYFADLNRIGMMGFSLGGTTTLWISGGRTTKLDNLAPPPGYADPNEFANLNEAIPFLNKEMMAKDWRDARVKAAFIMSPAWSWIFDESSLQSISIPAYLIAGADDTQLNADNNAGLFASHIPYSFYQKVLGKAGHFIFLAKPEEDKRALIDPSHKLEHLFTDDPSVDRNWIQILTADEATRFFLEML